MGRYPGIRHWTLVLLVVAAVAGTWRLSSRFATGLQSGPEIVDQPASSHSVEDSWRVATWNIHGGKGQDRRLDLGRIERELAEFDFIGLNEVRGASGLWGPNQAAAMAQSLDSGWLFMPYERRFGRDDFGNGVLSHDPVTNWIRMPLPNTCVKGHGNVTRMTVDRFSQNVHVLVTHIDHKQDRIRQLELVGQLFEALPPPAILMGDLNTQQDDKVLERILALPGVVEPFAACGKERPRKQIDWILVKGLACLDVGFTDSGASDHPLVWAELGPAVGARGTDSPVDVGERAAQSFNFPEVFRRE